MIIDTTEKISNVQFLEMFQSAAKAIIDRSQYLSELDMIGDADFGVNISRGFEEVLQKLSSIEDPDIGMILKTAGDVFVFDIGATIGGLTGRALQKAGKQMLGRKDLDAQGLTSIFNTMLATVEEVGGAKLGDKTLVDALEPAVNAANTAVASGITDIQEVLEATTSAAEEGAKSTASMISRIGRSSYLGERSRGTIDPGAMFIFLFLDAMRQEAQTSHRKRR